MHPVPCRSARKITLLGCPLQHLQILFSHNPWLSKCREYHITFSVQLSYFLIIEISYFLLVVRQGCCHCRGFWRYILQATVETNKLEAEGHSLVKSEHIVRLNNISFGLFWVLLTMWIIQNNTCVMLPLLLLWSTVCFVLPTQTTWSSESSDWLGLFVVVCVDILNVKTQIYT